MNDYFDFILQKLIAAGIENPRLETRILLAAVLQCAPSEIFGNVKLSVAQQRAAEDMLQQRLAHKPLDKIIGRREFYKANFVVNENVLSPRPDTEILVEEAIKLLPDTAVEILDLGTGSGCIIESILAEKPQARGVAVDISAAALQTARLNAENLQLTTRLDFVNADWFAPDFCAKIGKKFDMIVSNPPYIPTADIATLAAEVKNYDPAAALDGGADGYDSYRRIAELAPELLQNGGYILLEAGIGHAEKIADIFCNHKLKLINIVPDLNGISRCIILQK